MRISISGGESCIVKQILMKQMLYQFTFCTLMVSLTLHVKSNIRFLSIYFLNFLIDIDTFSLFPFYILKNFA